MNINLGFDLGLWWQNFHINLGFDLGLWWQNFHNPYPQFWKI